MKKFLFPLFFSLILVGSPVLVPASFVTTVEAQLLPCSPTTPTSPCRNLDSSIQPATSQAETKLKSYTLGVDSTSQLLAVGETDPEDPGDIDPEDPGETDPMTEKIVNPLSVDNIPELLAIILSVIIQIAIPFLVLAMMWVGFLFVAARGNASKLAEARQALYYTLIGAAIVLGAQTLAVILSGTISELTDIPTN